MPYIAGAVRSSSCSRTSPRPLCRMSLCFANTYYPPSSVGCLPCGICTKSSRSLEHPVESRLLANRIQIGILLNPIQAETAPQGGSQKRKGFQTIFGMLFGGQGVNATDLIKLAR